MHENIMARLLKMMPTDSGMALPPPVFMDMEGKFIEFVEGERLVARYPNNERYMNPFGFMQGGIIVAAMDNTVSPLSYAVAQPSITQGIEATFKRPVRSSDRFIDVVATVLARTSAGISLKADVLNEKGKLAASGSADCVFIKGRSEGF